MREAESIDVSDAECMKGDGRSEGAWKLVGMVVVYLSTQTKLVVQYQWKEKLHLTFSLFFTEDVRQQIVTLQIFT